MNRTSTLGLRCQNIPSQTIDGQMQCDPHSMEEGPGTGKSLSAFVRQEMETRTAMSTSHRSKRKAVKDWFRKRMTRTTPALASAESLDDRLARVVSYREAIPLIDELLPSIQIGLDEPAFIIDWQPTNVAAFVFVANQMNPAQAPPWLRTKPGGMTPESFMDDVVNKVQPDVDRRRGWVFLAPNTMEQYGAILGRFIAIQNAPFLQDVAQAALPVINNVEPYLAVTYFLTESRAQRAQPVNLQPNCFNERTNASALYLNVPVSSGVLEAQPESSCDTVGLLKSAGFLHCFRTDDRQTRGISRIHQFSKVRCSASAPTSSNR